MLGRFDILFMNPRIASQECFFVNGYFGQQILRILTLGGIVHLHVPDSREVSVLLCVCHRDADVSCFACSLIYHGRTLLRVLCLVGIELPVDAVNRGLYLVLIEEGGILKLCPYLVELLLLAEVYGYPLLTVALAGTP